ncbi:MAG TPA: CDP-alcohol phosphatidyltransferase family protein [Polyangiaceae bacterium LLY-WYZ-14_1]|nr:CDP-alcohol phosphatidyltransferase family protein [Polyangiaceae bacterium LLY-WYZ-14_1]
MGEPSEASARKRIRIRRGDLAIEGVFSLPNLLTLVRLPLAVAIWWAATDPGWALAVLLAAGGSDVLDGWFARRVRRWRWERTGDPRVLAAGTDVGAWLDPVCDKVFVVSAVAALTIRLDPPLSLVAALLAREGLVLVLLVGREALAGPWTGRGYDFTAGWPGKATTVLQFAAMALLIFRHPWFGPAALLAGALGLYAPVWHARRALAGPNSG